MTLKYPKPQKRRKKEDRISFKAALKRADSAFAKFIKARDGNICCTCGKHSKRIECGHFIPRGHMAIRFDERNSHSQCTRCNHYLGGDPVRYRKFMIEQYGMRVVEELEIKSQMSIHRKAEDLLWLEKHFKEKLNALNETMGVLRNDR